MNGDSMTRIIRLQVDAAKALSDLRQLRAANEQGSRAMRDQSRATKEMSASLDTLGRSTGNVVAFSRSLRGIAENARGLRSGFANAGQQIQDLAIVASSGGASLGNLSIQVGQLASGFGPVGVAIGTATTLLGILGGAFLASRTAAASFAEAIDEIEPAVARARENFALLAYSTELFRRFGEDSQRLRAEIGRAFEIDVAAVNQQIAAAVETIYAELERLVARRRTQLRPEAGGFAQEQIAEAEAFARTIDRLQQDLAEGTLSAEAAISAFEELGPAVAASVGPTDQLRREIDSLNKDFDRQVVTMREQMAAANDLANARGLVADTLAELATKEGAAAAAADALADALDRIGPAAGRSADELYRLQVELFRLRAEAVRVPAPIAAAAELAGDIGAALERDVDQAKGEIERIADQRSQLLGAREQAIRALTAATDTATQRALAGGLGDIDRGLVALDARARLVPPEPAARGGGGAGAATAATAALREQATLTRFLAELERDRLEAAELLAAAQQGPETYEALQRQYELADAVRSTQEQALRLAEAQGYSAAETAAMLEQVRAGVVAVETAEQQATETIERMGFVTGALAENLEQGIGGAMSNFIDLIFEGEASFSQFAETVLTDIAKIIVEFQVMTALKALFAAIGGGGFGLGIGGFGVGAAFDQHGVMPFAAGGVVDRPTLFPFARGGVGMMGEVFPEAIVPLHRGASGELGVRAEAPPFVVNINNNIPGADVQVEERRGPGATMLEITIAREIEKAIGSGRLDRMMGSTYGLNRRGRR